MEYRFGSDIAIEILKRSKEAFPYVEAFDCGDENLNFWIKEDFRKSQTVAYLFVDKANKTLVAYCSMACSGIMTIAEDANPEILDPKTIIPSIEIKFFAVDNRYRSLRMEETSKRYDTLSALIFQYCIYIACNAAEEHIGADALLLYSVPKAKSFYKRNGFVEFSEEMLGDQSGFVEGCVPMYRIISHNIA